MANLAYGSSGSDVRALQEALRKAGYNIAADGVYGAETRNAVRQYQSAQGLGVDGIAGQQTFGSLGIGSGGSTAGGGYNNSGLTTDQIVEMQNYYGTAADGLWGQNSTAAAGGLNAQQAWQQYQQQKQQQAQQQMQETMMPSMMGFEDFYNRMGGADFEKMLRENINASVQQAVNSYEAQKQETEQDAQEMARQAYVAKLLGEKNMAQRLAAGGYAGGMAESAMLESETNYQNNLAEIQRQRQRALDEIQRAIDNARLTGDMEMANQLADYMAQVQSYYSDYYDQMLSQQMQMQRAQAEAAQAEAAQAAASAATPSVTQSYTPSVTPTPAQPMTSSAALNAAVRDAGGSAAQTIRNLQTMYNNGQINAAQLRDLSYAVANPGK
ncbi:MAG: peptidoglycan-binding protein [Oscillospiraceae bacterium]|nr:peptidoglycan-binding protein [Oscillospiraceae bacterium]